MTDSISVFGVEAGVVSSEVRLQITNAAGKQITINRTIVDAARDKHLISVQHGPALTVGGTYVATDFYVRRPGSATNEAGFHKYLQEFLDFDLPRVTRMDGSEGPLYLETIFPYFFVEQKHGWSGIQARVPTYLGIRDVGRRSAEFILGLGASDRVLLRQRISSNIAELQSSWQVLVGQIVDRAAKDGITLRGTSELTAKSVEGVERFRPQIAIGETWTDLSRAIADLEKEIEVGLAYVEPAGEAADRVEEELSQHQGRLRELISLSNRLTGERGEVFRRVSQIDLRLEALEQDLRKHRDAKVLQNLGSSLALSSIADHVCPTCHQDLQDGSEITQHPMSIDENIRYIQQQLATFNGSRGDYVRVTTAIDLRLQNLAREIRAERRSIRAAQETLVSPNSSPSVSDISTRLSSQHRLSSLVEASADISRLKESLAQVETRFHEQGRLLREVRGDELSDSDKAILRKVGNSMVMQLDAYGFKSIEPSQVEISKVTYRPNHEGFDLGFDLSASDMIRVIWAYLFALLDAGSGPEGNHLGLLIFDEPKQQDTAKESYRSLLQHALKASESGAQVIFATSESSLSLRSMVAQESCNLIDLAPGEKLLQAE
ncbi:hypothetical protein [Rhodococcus sp. Leaf278]|uniref:hypothetical protein n=1 Tax=Rhodococcus sp. Leaf278 TaxID=1736319 RepID=UPI0012E3C0EA|nr:hypothetical protein [Rhodococcus sp. Leaf278]